MDAVSKVIAEGNALTRALAVVEDGGSTAVARRLCEIYLVQHDVDDLESYAIDCALRKICSVDPTDYSIPHAGTDDVDGCLFELGVRAWTQWAREKMIGEGLNELPRCDATRCLSLDLVRSTFDVMALTRWVTAVENLTLGDVETSRRYFRRAAILGGEYGTASNPVIQWTYAASFFPAS